MNEIAPSLKAWESFYVIVGSSAGALTGLQFVVLTLIAQSGPSPRRGESISAFGSPNVVHFCSALLVSALLSAPWGNLDHAGRVLSTCGFAGVLYSLVVLRRTMRQQVYRPVFEDWLWHNALPLIAYATLVVSGFLLGRAPVPASFATGGVTLLLVFIGIHNAWDTVMYVTIMGLQTREPEVGQEAERANSAEAPASPPRPGGPAGAS